VAQPTEDPAQRTAQLCYLFGNSYHLITVATVPERR
jgi:hypothetical protein